MVSVYFVALSHALLILCVPSDFVENWTFGYYNVITLEIIFSSFPNVCCYLLKVVGGLCT